MTSCTDGFSLVKNIHVRPLLGESSTLDEVFLDRASHEEHGVHTDLNYNTPKGYKHLKTEEDSGSTDSENENDFFQSGPSCYQLSISSIILISVTCLLMVTCRQYIKDVMLWLENVDPIISCCIFLVLFIVVSFPLTWGYILFMVAAGYLYGYIYGPIMVLMCGTIGIVTAHLVMKNCCRDFIIHKFHNRKMDAVIKVVESEQGFKLVALARLTPIPFGLQNGLFALTDISLWSYCASSTLGLVPTTILNCYIGSTFRTMTDVLSDGSSQTTGYIIFFFQIVLTFLLLWFVVRKARSELKKTVEGRSMQDLEFTEILTHDTSTKEVKVSMNGVIHT